MDKCIYTLFASEYAAGRDETEKENPPLLGLGAHGPP